MVYFGPSKACITCKRRRKKCDETRPTCNRCHKANRPCAGYDRDASDLFIKQITLPQPETPEVRGQPSSLAAGGSAAPLARKCALPRQQPSSRHLLPSPAEPPLPAEVPAAESEHLVLRAFLHDYCVAPVNPHSSRGFLARVEPLVRELGFGSSLADACRAVELAKGSRHLGRPSMLVRGKALYQSLLGHMARALAGPAWAKSAEALMLAMLLGLFEMTVASPEADGHHLTHAHGVAAVLEARSECPLSFLKEFEKRPVLDLNGRAMDLFTVPSQRGSPPQQTPARGLDSLLMQLGRVWHQAAAVLESRRGDRGGGGQAEELGELRRCAASLHRELGLWAQTRSPDFRPTPVGAVAVAATTRVRHVERQGGETSAEWPQKQQQQYERDDYNNWAAAADAAAPGLWPGRVDTYPDLYIARVWNTYASGHLVLLDLRARVDAAVAERGGDDGGGRFPEGEEEQTFGPRAREEATACLIATVLSSIPYHLVENLQEFLKEADGNKRGGGGGAGSIANPGRPAGGLLLMHPLHILINLSILPERHRAYLRRCLAWVGAEMGVGYAAVLAGKEVDHGQRLFGSDSFIIWSGFLGRL